MEGNPGNMKPHPKDEHEMLAESFRDACGGLAAIIGACTALVANSRDDELCNETERRFAAALLGTLEKHSTVAKALIEALGDLDPDEHDDDESLRKWMETRFLEMAKNARRS